MTGNAQLAECILNCIACCFNDVYHRRLRFSLVARVYGAGEADTHEDGIFVVYRCDSRISSKSQGSAIFADRRVDQRFFAAAY